MNRGASYAWALGVALLICTSPSKASGLEQKGAPTSHISALNTYGMDVPTRVGLKAILPKGWQLFIHQSAQVPPSVSWKVGDTWLSVLAALSQATDLAVMVDWDTQTVLVRTQDVAIQELATRAEISQAAITPLPKFGLKERDTRSSLPPAEPVLTSPSTQEVAASATTSQAATQGIKVDLPVVSQDVPSNAMPAQRVEERTIQSNGDFTYSEALALNRPDVKRVAAAVANKYGYSLVWIAGGMKLQNPVTLLARNVQEDVSLLQKAMGVYSPVKLEIIEAAKQIIAVDRSLSSSTNVTAQRLEVKNSQVLSSPSVFADSKNSSPAPQSTATPTSKDTAVEVAKEDSTQVKALQIDPVSEIAPVPGPAPVVTPVTKMALSVHKGESLEEAIAKFAASRGYTLEWKIKGGFESNRDISFEGETLAQVLTQVLPPLGVSADIYTQNKHLIIRPGLRSGR